MKMFFLKNLLLITVFTSCSSLQKPPINELIVCGGPEVYILDISNKKSPQKVWSWKAENSSGLPAEYVRFFRSTDECKPVDKGTKILITSSSGGAALVKRSSKEVLFYAKSPNAHSAEYLPGGRIAVACSHAKGGDSLIIFDIKKPNTELYRVPLEWGHGVVWDNERQKLYALSGGELQTFKLKNWQTAQPELTKISSVKLPERMGHDLQPVRNSELLSFSTDNHCWFYNRENKEISFHSSLKNKSHVKCISEHPLSGQIAYIHGENGHWWAENIRFTNPKEIIHLKGAKIYKVRWSRNFD